MTFTIKRGFVTKESSLVLTDCLVTFHADSLVKSRFHAGKLK